MDRKGALDLLDRYVSSPSLRNHCIATAAVMRALADRLDEDADLWETIGILHDIDYEVVDGDMERHGPEGAAILGREGIDEKICSAVERHNHLLHAPYTSRLDLCLQTADSISGLVIACALVKGGAVEEVSPRSVRKKLKDRSFAAGCDRDRIAAATAFIDADDLYAIAIASVVSVKTELGLR
ncbi:HDIG domain-containing metalloprotein [Methanofollis fontis]|uniref:Phosphohydrolase n=1 Tax=Methanofollis fontis TaxID=2052832 RepID=A0A483CXK0_9EURY|nr:HDIG domain-containing metalloprotein [Methanofollis fontis]TAJ44649.1 phosphohydrolase [Methanofollis fontis]